MAKKMTYESANKELVSILSDLERDAISIDNLPKTIKRARELITFCKEKLRNVELEVSNLLQDDE